VNPQFEKILPALVTGGVEFIVIGGFAGMIHGSARVTFDVDLVYSRDKANIDRLAAILSTCSPRLRDSPPGLEFSLDAQTIRHGCNFTLATNLGDLDLFGDVPGAGSYHKLLSHSSEVEAFGVQFKCVDLGTLIRIKEAAGRPKDLEAIAELRVLLQEQSNRS
jgi:predicted nucleotidyltransferase